MTSDVGDLRQIAWHTLLTMKFARLVAALWLCGSVAGVIATGAKTPGARQGTCRRAPAETPAEVPAGPPPEEQAPDADHG